MATFHDSSQSISLMLTDGEAVDIGNRVSHLGGLELLENLHRERRARRRTAALSWIGRRLGR